MKKLSFLITIFLFTGLTLFAQSKDVLTVAGHEANLTLDPIATTMRTVITHTRPLMFDSLVTRDEIGNFKPSLATSWKTINELTWEFSLRKGVKFHNGEKFDASSVQKTYGILLDPKQRKSQGFLWSGIDRIEKIDDYTVRIHTKKPMGTLLSNLAIGALVPPSYNYETFGTKPIGTGPYKFVEWVRGDHLTVEANNSYWRGSPSFKKVIWYPMAEESTRVATAMTGEVDIISVIPTHMASVLDANPNVNLMSVTSINTPHLALGGKARTGPVGGNPLVLKAIAHAIDRDRIAKEAFRGYAWPASSSHAPGVLGHCPVDFGGYDPEKSKKLLAQAGFPDGISGLDSWYVKGAYPNIDEVAVLIHDMLRNVGIHVDIRIAPDWAVAGPLLNGGNFNVWYEAWNNYVLDADFFLSFNFHSKGRYREGFERYPVWQEMDKLIEQARFNHDQDKRREIYCKTEKLISQYPARLPLVHYKELYAVSSAIKGFKPKADGSIDYLSISK